MSFRRFKDWLRGLRLVRTLRKRPHLYSRGFEPLETRCLLTFEVTQLTDSNRQTDNVVALDDVVLFVATDGTGDRQLWKTDGTTAGTVLVKEINPSGPDVTVDLIRLDSSVYFSVVDGTHGMELWKTDGTTEGTLLVKDINPEGGSYPHDFRVMNGVLFFIADDGAHGRELWKSDGSESGTVLVTNLNPAGDSDANYLTDVNGTLYFSVNHGAKGSELWKSDGTESGTSLVAVINPVSGYNISTITNVNGTVYFSANDGNHGHELWKSDGTESGTVMVKDLNTTGDPNYPGSYPLVFASFQGSVFFRTYFGSNGAELWKTDGTESGTVLVNTVPQAPDIFPEPLTNLDGQLYFPAGDATHGYELWKSDGTTEGTTLVLDLNPGGSSNPSGIVTIDSRLFFAADDGTHGAELWTSDGTAAGTMLVADLYLGADSFPLVYQEFNGEIYLTAADGLRMRDLFKITQTNHPTSDLMLSSMILPHGSPAGTEVGTFTSTDPDPEDHFTYRLVSGTGDDDNGSFSITDNLLTITTPVDAGAKSTYSIRVSTTDQGGLSVEKQFTFTVHTAPVVTLNPSEQVGRLKWAFVVDSGATLTDPDSPDYTGGSIRVSITGGKQNNELIGLLRKFNSSIGLLKVANGDIKHGKQVIGHVSGGTDGQDLVITFTSGVTKAVAQDILRAVAFSSRVAGQRTLSFTVQDNTLLSSQSATRGVSLSSRQYLIEN